MKRVPDGHHGLSTYSSVDTVPDPTRYGIKGANVQKYAVSKPGVYFLAGKRMEPVNIHLKSERSSENCSQEDSIPPEEGPKMDRQLVSNGLKIACSNLSGALAGREW